MTAIVSALEQANECKTNVHNDEHELMTIDMMCVVHVHDANVGNVPVGERLGHASAHVVAHVETARTAGLINNVSI